MTTVWSGNGRRSGHGDTVPFLIEQRARCCGRSKLAVSQQPEGTLWPQFGTESLSQCWASNAAASVASVVALIAARGPRLVPAVTTTAGRADGAAARVLGIDSPDVYRLHGIEIELLDTGRTGLAWADDMLSGLEQRSASDSDHGRVSLNWWFRRRRQAFRLHRAALIQDVRAASSEHNRLDERMLFCATSWRPSGWGAASLPTAKA